MSSNAPPAAAEVQPSESPVYLCVQFPREIHGDTRGPGIEKLYKKVEQNVVVGAGSEKVTH